MIRMIYIGDPYFEKLPFRGQNRYRIVDRFTDTEIETRAAIAASVEGKFSDNEGYIVKQYFFQRPNIVKFPTLRKP